MFRKFSKCRILLVLIIPAFALLMTNEAVGQVTFKNIQPDVGENFSTYPNGAGWGDVDNDGDLDVYVAVGSGQGFDIMLNDLSVSGKFIKADTTMAHFVRTSGPRATMMADADNDGDLDLVAVGEDDQIWLLINKLVESGSLSFEDVSEELGIAHIGEAYYGPSMADYDNDGKLDLFVGGMAKNGWYPSLLFHNISAPGEGLAYEELADQAGIYSLNGMNIVGGFWGDYDDDGDQDIFIATSGAWPEFLYRNEGDGTFTDVTLDIGMSEAIGDSRYAVWGDYDNDCDLDIFIGRRTYDTLPDMDICQLYRNDGGVFEEVLSARIQGQVFYGVAAADYDNDGDLDLHLLDSNSADFMLRNDGNMSFENVTADVSLLQYEDPGGWGMLDIDDRGGQTWADWDADGDLDLFLPSSSGRKPYLMQNNGGNSNNWLELKLTGVQSNRSAVGARVIAITDDLRQMREVIAGSLYSGPPLDVHFGFGQKTIVDSLIICWPSGHEDIMTGVAVNQMLSIEEGSTAIAIDDKDVVSPEIFALAQNYPNPFNPATEISYQLSTTGHVRIDVYSMLGQHVATIVDAVQPSGAHKIHFSAENLSAGVYFYRLMSGEFTDQKKMILLK